MNKTLLTLIVTITVVALVAAGGVFVYLQLSGSKPAPSDGGLGGFQSSGGTVTTGSNPQTTGSSTSTTTGNNGSGGIATKDFLHATDTLADPHNPGQYFLAGTGKIDAAAPPYNILYVAADQSFTIALTREPLRDSRLGAEHALQASLGIPQADMCSLRYTVLVPYSVNQFYSGQNLGFSFCPDATPLQ